MADSGEYDRSDAESDGEIQGSLFKFIHFVIIYRPLSMYNHSDDVKLRYYAVI